MAKGGKTNDDMLRMGRNLAKIKNQNKPVSKVIKNNNDGSGKNM